MIFKSHGVNSFFPKLPREIGSPLNLAIYRLHTSNSDAWLEQTAGHRCLLVYRFGLIPLQQANHLRARMHGELLKLSSRCTQTPAVISSHFVWIDQPEVIVQSVAEILNSEVL